MERHPPSDWKRPPGRPRCTWTQQIGNGSTSSVHREWTHDTARGDATRSALRVSATKAFWRKDQLSALSCECLCILTSTGWFLELREQMAREWLLCTIPCCRVRTNNVYCVVFDTVSVERHGLLQTWSQLQDSSGTPLSRSQSKLRSLYSRSSQNKSWSQFWFLSTRYPSTHTHIKAVVNSLPSGGKADRSKVHGSDGVF